MVLPRPALRGEGRGEGLPRNNRVTRMAEDATRNSMKQELAAGELVLCMNPRLAHSVDIAMVAKAGGYDARYVDR